MFLRFVELIAAAIILVFFVTQVWLPMSKGRPTFPILRKQGRLEKELAEVKQQEAEKELETAVEQAKLNLSKKHPPKTKRG